jgi:hypothetical protein
MQSSAASNVTDAPAVDVAASQLNALTSSQPRHPTALLWMNL